MKDGKMRNKIEMKKSLLIQLTDQYSNPLLCGVILSI